MDMGKKEPVSPLALVTWDGYEPMFLLYCFVLLLLSSSLLIIITFFIISDLLLFTIIYYYCY